MSSLLNIFERAFSDILKEQGTPCYCERTKESFSAVLAPTYETETVANLRITRNVYHLTLLNSVDVVVGDSLKINGRAFLVLPFRDRGGVLGLDEVAKKIRIIENVGSGSNSGNNSGQN